MQQITKFQIKDVDASTVEGDMSLTTLSITSTADATSTVTGSIQTLGGLGVAKSIHSASLTTGPITGTTITGTTSVSGGTISGTTITGSSTVTGNVVVSTATTNATSPTTGSIRSAGGIGAANDIYAGGDVSAFSDIRLKTNIEKIENALEKTCALNGYVYDRTDMKLRQTGLIAQEVLEVLPEAVKGSEEDMYGINYGSMIGLMVEAIKEIKAEIDNIKTKIGA